MKTNFQMYPILNWLIVKCPLPIVACQQCVTGNYSVLHIVEQYKGVIIVAACRNIYVRRQRVPGKID